ncbi:pilus assembly protein FilA [Acinetobacter sp. WCHAc060033]|uniref:putative pilus system protein FilA n=1 Tax=Acinetobacter sp. WCHAc060033 TaxID=2518624 RepID=UPI001023EABE|nr:DUF6160 family protein [Acinetobacter sp. WCHAc060033]RZG78751.1 pilus assembly protein FilA [Acinetobacter sp. WCHAc060033]
MKLFTKLALVSAVAVSSNAMAMQAMDDAALSSTTGQDGISIGIGISRVEIDKLHVFDGDGLAGGYNTVTVNSGVVTSTPTTAAAGAITINDVVVGAPMTAKIIPDPNDATKQIEDPSGAKTLDVTRTISATDHNLANLVIDTDGGNGSPFLNVAATVSGLDISLGKIEVNDVTSSSKAGAYVAGTGSAEILSGLSLKTGRMTANIQLGNTPQGAMIKLDGSMIGGLEINDLALKDASAGGGGYITIGGIKLKDTGTSDLALNADVAVTKEGLAVTAMKNAAGTDIYITKVVLGGGTIASGDTPFQGTGAGSASIGDVAISGMKVWNGAAGLAAIPGAANGAVITIAGH